MSHVEQFDVVDLIRTKRDRGELLTAEINWMIDAYTRGYIADEQMAAMTMAIFLNGMERREIRDLTLAMIASGETMNFDSLSKPTTDKHSTGGVGDKITLPLAPLVASFGVAVPQLSGRGLGHTGGTLDKLDAIPGYVSVPDNARLREVVREVGCAIIGQTADLAPADRRLYAIRDVTATVESIPLITASILSKKLAAGLHGLAMDVKTGSGAFMATLEGSRGLAQSLVQVANGAGLPTTALITGMDAPLADVAGNALEIAYAIAYLTGTRREPRMHEVVLALGAEMLVLGRLAASLAEARQKLEAAITSGQAADRFTRMVAALGGPVDLMARPGHYLASAPMIQPVYSNTAGFVARIDTRGLGLAVVALGGGRTRQHVGHRQRRLGNIGAEDVEHGQRVAR